jgi:hypothetical protein
VLTSMPSKKIVYLTTKIVSRPLYNTLFSFLTIMPSKHYMLYDKFIMLKFDHVKKYYILLHNYVRSRIYVYWNNITCFITINVFSFYNIMIFPLITFHVYLTITMFKDQIITSFSSFNNYANRVGAEIDGPICHKSKIPIYSKY